MKQQDPLTNYDLWAVTINGSIIVGILIGVLLVAFTIKL